MTEQKFVQSSSSYVKDRLEEASRCHRDGNFAVTERICRELLVDAALIPVIFNMLESALRRQHRAFEVVVALREALSLAPKFADAWNSLANALCELGELREAAVAAKRALELDPENEVFKANLSRVIGFISIQKKVRKYATSVKGCSSDGEQCNPASRSNSK